MSVGSSQRPPMNVTPTGSGPTKAAGTVMSGYPAMADGLDEPTNFEKSPPRSPFTGSVTQATLLVGEMIASRWLAAMRSSIAALAVEVASVRAAVQAGSDRPPVAWARSNRAEFQ